jgi:hypothetical protein
MSAKLHQLHLAYHPVEDRLLFRMSTQDRAEYRLWLTRRFVQSLWPILMKILETDEQVVHHQDPGTKKTILAFQHQRAVAKTDYKKKYDETVTEHPLGSQPLVVSKLAVKMPTGGNPVLCMHTEKGQGVELAMSRELTHSFVRLLADTLAKTDWELNLDALPEPERVPSRVN